MNEVIRILLVDDQELVRQGLRGMLAADKDMEVVGDCANAEEAFSKITRLHPDFVLMDINMPGMNGIEATRSLKRDELDYGVDVIILAESLDYRAAALAAGAANYLLKDITRMELAQTIRQVYRHRHSLAEYEGLIEEAIELVVPPPANASWLLSFMCQLEETLHDNFASIIYTSGSWDYGTVITILSQPTTLPSILSKLANMPGVDKVEEEPLTRGVFANLPRKFGLMPKPRISPSRRIRLTPKEPQMVSQEWRLR